MRKSIIHVARQAIQRNAKHGTNEPPLIVRTSGKSKRAHELVVVDENGKELVKIVHSPHKPLACGARVWIETMHQVIATEHPEEAAQ